jgi:hypothetical protein
MLVLARSIARDNLKGKQVVLVHNLREFTQEDLERRDPIDGMDYVTRVELLFFLQRMETVDPVKPDAVAGAVPGAVDEGQKVMWLHGAYAYDEHNAVRVAHVFLTKEDYAANPRCKNKYVIPHIRNIIQGRTVVNRTLAEDLCVSADLAQEHLVRMVGLRPKFSVTDDNRLVATTDAENRPQVIRVPLGTYFANASGDVPYNVSRMTGTVKVMDARTRKISSREVPLFVMQCEVPGLGEHEVKRLQSELVWREESEMREDADMCGVFQCRQGATHVVGVRFVADVEGSDWYDREQFGAIEIDETSTVAADEPSRASSQRKVRFLTYVPLYDVTAAVAVEVRYAAGILALFFHGNPV